MQRLIELVCLFVLRLAHGGLRRWRFDRSDARRRAAVRSAFLGFVFAVCGAIPEPSLGAQSVANVPNAANAGDRIALDASREIVERDADAQAMLDVLNAERVGQGLEPLAFDPRLGAIARSHAVDMAVRSYFGHVTFEGEGPFDRLNRAHVRYGYAGENLALDANVTLASSELWRSSEHRSNILQPRFARVGIAAVRVADGEIFVEEFSD